MLTITDQQRAVLEHVLLDADAWLANAIEALGEDRAAEALAAKVSTHGEAYYAAVLADPEGYQTRAQREAPLPLTLDQARAGAVAAVEAELTRRFDLGFAYDFGVAPADFEDGSTGSAGAQILQTRDDRDRTNWLILDNSCLKLIAAGAGATLVQARTMSNAIVTISAVDCSAMLAAMAAYGGAVMAASWALKNAIRQAADVAAVQAVDITAGWP